MAGGFSLSAGTCLTLFMSSAEADLIPAQRDLVSAISPSTPSRETAQLPLRVHVDPDIDDATLIPLWIEDRNPNIGSTLLEPGTRQWVSIVIEGSTYRYRLAVTGMHDGVPARAEREPILCECNSETLLDLIDREIAITIDHMAHLRAEALAKASRSIVTDVAHPTHPTRPIQDEEESSRPGPRASEKLRTAGLTTGILGLLFVGGGASLLAAPEDIKGYTGLYRDFDSPGIAGVTIGATMVAAALTMFTLDALRWNRTPKHARHRDKARARMTWRF